MPGGKASSFHLIWRFAAQDREARLSEVSAVLEIVTPPTVPALYFWALQVDFADSRGVWGGGHTGLQWNRRYPGNTAVSWGGYSSSERGGAVLPGTVSALPGFSDDPNTLSYDWSAGRRYRLRVHPSPEVAGAWRAEVSDLEAGWSSPIRDLLPPGISRSRAGLLQRIVSRGRDLVGAGDDAGDVRGGDGGADEGGSGHSGFLVRPIVWSEVFAECDDPSVIVRWSDLQALDERGAVLRPEAVVANYQAGHDGGCPNTDSRIDGSGGLAQTTNTLRRTSPGTTLSLR